MKKQLLLFPVLFFLFSMMPAKAQQGTFTKVFIDTNGSAQAYSIAKAYDGTYIVAGEKDGQVSVLKMNSSADILWSRKYESYYAYFNNIIATRDSCFVAAGTTGQSGILIVKIKPDGDTLWSTLINPGNGYATSVQQTADDGYIISGALMTAGSQYALIIAKLDAAGHFIWSKCLLIYDNFNTACSVKQTPDGGYAIIGSTIYMSTYTSQAVLIKLNSAGEISWSRILDSGISGTSSGVDLLVAEDGLICLIVLNDNTTVLQKTDFAGNYIFGHRYPGSLAYSWNTPKTQELRRTSDNGYVYIVSGGVMKIDSTWHNSWITDLFMYTTDVVESDDHGFLVIGNGPLMGVSMAPWTNSQVGIVKTDSAGYTTDCMTPEFPYTEIDSSYFIPVAFDSIALGSAVPYQATVSDAPLFIFSGCVAVTGGITGKKTVHAGVSIFPNPSNGKIRFKTEYLNSSDFRMLEIYNSTGTLVYSTDDPLILEKEICLDQAAYGVYFARIVLARDVCSARFIISR